MTPFPRAVFGDDARLGEIHFARDPLYKRLRTGDDGGDLKRFLQKPLEKQCAHKVANSEPRVPRCPATISPDGLSGPPQESTLPEPRDAPPSHRRDGFVRVDRWAIGRAPRCPIR